MARTYPGRPQPASVRDCAVWPCLQAAEIGFRCPERQTAAIVAGPGNASRVVHRTPPGCAGVSLAMTAAP